MQVVTEGSVLLDAGDILLHLDYRIGLKIIGQNDKANVCFAREGVPTKVLIRQSCRSSFVWQETRLINADHDHNTIDNTSQLVSFYPNPHVRSYQILSTLVKKEVQECLCPSQCYSAAVNCVPPLLFCIKRCCGLHE